MGLDRRNFIKFVVGGVAGLHVTPLPFKLMDDVAIWTQNWPWVPVPPEGEFTHVRSVCKLCPGGCGIETRKVDDRAVKIEGRTDYPVNPGGICPTGMGGLQLLYNKSIRFTSPMKRLGPRGEGEFIEISWDEALNELSNRIANLREKGSPEALVAVDGNAAGSTMATMVERLVHTVGSPNYVTIPSAEDTFAMTNDLMRGTSGPIAYDLENSDFVLSFGSGLLEGWGAPGRVLNAWSLWRDSGGRKTKIVQIESRASNTASKADQWIAIKPGTEAALALGLAHVIIKKWLHDFRFVNNHSSGFHRWQSPEDGKAHKGFKDIILEKYSPDQVAEITGLDSAQIVSLAKNFARAKAPVAICGRGKGSLNGSLYEFMAVEGLNALMGRINQPGGVLVHDPLPLSPLPEIVADAVAKKGLAKPRIDQADSEKYPFTRSLINNLADVIKTSSHSPVDTLMVFAANPAYTLPDCGSFRNALKKIPFIVSFSPYRDETSNMADLILPDHTYLEKMDDVVWPAGLQYPLYGLTQPVVDPLYDTRNTGDVIIDLAKRIGKSVASAFPWRDYEAVLKVRAKGLYESEGGRVGYDNAAPVWQQQKEARSIASDYKSFGKMWAKIKSGGLWYRPTHTYKNWETLFKTPTGKFEFSSTRIQRAINDYTKKTSEETAYEGLGLGVKGDDALIPHYETLEHEASHDSYPLMMVPYEMINLASGWVPNPPFAYKTLFDDQLFKNESFIMINPKTAAKYGLKDNDKVIIKSSAGKAKVLVNLFEGAMPDIVFMPLGFGHTAYDEFVRGKGVNANDIIVAGKDPLSGHPIWWNTPVKLIKV